MDSSFYTASFSLGWLYSAAHNNVGQGTMEYCVEHNTSLQEARGGEISTTDGVGAVPDYGNISCHGTYPHADPGWPLGELNNQVGPRHNN